MSSPKKKSPAEELMDSLLNEVEGSDGQNLDGFVLDSDESMGEFKESSNDESSVEESDQNLEGIMNLDSTSVGAISFEGFLRDNRGGASLDKTEVRTRVQPMQNPNNGATQIIPSKAKESSQATPEMQTAMESQFSSEEVSAYEATRVAPAPNLEGENEHTEFGELELEPMEANVVDLKELVEKNPRAPNSSFSDVPYVSPEELAQAVSLFDAPPSVPMASLSDENVRTQVINTAQPLPTTSMGGDADSQIATVAIRAPTADPGRAAALGSVFEDVKPRLRPQASDNEGTIAVTGFQIKSEDNLEGKVKVSVGKSSRSSGFSSWGGGVDSNLSQAENLRMAQEKILELENENERTRRQNEELIAASEILKERSDLMTAQLTEYKNDREGLEQSFKNEMTLLKNHLVRKDAELKKAQFKVEELEARLKFDLKKIRVRERELENRLELVRAEKNAISKNKDEQILDLRRKMDVIQMEVDSYRQKCVELNKQIENSQDSFKRTTRALRLAMANLELQEENKGQLKKAE